MTTYLLVHGAWGGNHSWRDFAPILWAAGHEVFTPCLTGLGERVHLARPETNLSDHIQDVLNVIEYQDLHDIVLVGHSYGGMVVTGVADRAPDRIRHLVYEDAFLPRDGESCWPAERVEQSVGEDGWSVLRPEVLPETGPPGPANAGQLIRRSAQPARTLDEPVHLSRRTEEHDFSRTYVKAAGRPKTPEDERRGSFWEAAARVSADSAWRYFELPCGHGIHRELPKEFAGILLALG
jgi:pimeloyl-ACP methyl ester carboxylesterase